MGIGGGPGIREGELGEGNWGWGIAKGELGRGNEGKMGRVHWEGGMGG